MKRVAIFDIDGTIFRSSLTIELYAELVRSGIFSKRSWDAIEKKHTKWLDREGGYDKYMWEVVKWYHKEIVGVQKKDVVAASRRMLKSQKKRTYRYTRHLIESLRQNYFLIGISGSSLEVVEEYNKFLRFDKLYGTELGIDETGRYTGKVIHSPWEYKKELIVRYVSKHKMSLRNSIGVGDTEADIGFLQLVDKPVAFNPNSELAHYARRKNWTLVIERKDIVVEFRPKQVKYLKI